MTISDICDSHVTRCDLSLVTRFNSLLTRFNSLLTRFDSLLTRFDSLVTRFNSLLTRCTEQPELCGSPGAQILEKEGGVWSDQFSPFDGHFKVGGPP